MAVMKWMYDQLRYSHVCSTCHGQRLRKEALSVRVGGLNIWELSNLSVKDSVAFFESLELTDMERDIARQILKEIKSTWLSYAQPRQRHALRRRSAAHQACNPDRFGSFRRALCS